jgi:hypothetical protein
VGRFLLERALASGLWAGLALGARGSRLPASHMGEANQNEAREDCQRDYETDKGPHDEVKP